MNRRGRLPRILRRPEQGWSSLFLLLALLVLLGVSVADARESVLVLSEAAGSSAGSLPVLMLAAGLVGFLLARSRIGVVRAHVIGAAVAAGVLLLVAGDALLADPAVVPPEGAISGHVGAVWVRLEEDLRQYYAETLPAPPVVAYVVLGAFCWTTAQFSAFSIFRYDRGGPAVVAIGAALFLNLALGSYVPEAQRLPVLPVLAAFAALAMLLLMRMQLVAQQLQWARRHISDTGEVSRLFLRSGAIFVAITVVSATSLTVVATVEAQDVELGALEQPIKDFGDEIARVLGIAGVPPAPNVPTARGESSPIQENWDPEPGLAFRARIPEGQLRRNYWWGWADDQFRAEQGDLGSWASTDTESDPLPAGAIQSSPSEAWAGGVHPARVEITLEEWGAQTAQAFRLAEASVWSEDVSVWSDSESGSISDIRYEDSPDAGETVVVESFVRDYSPDGRSLTANQLRASAEFEYPLWTEKYLQGAGAERAYGSAVVELARDIEARGDTPFDRAFLLQEEFHSGRYAYDTAPGCSGYRTVADCVVEQRAGFCQHYATTMALMLREMDIPSRYVTGYLPGKLDPDTETWTVEQAAFHTWVEAFFPDYGWVRFDPTPGQQDFGLTPTVLDDGPDVRDGTTPTPEPTFEVPTFEPSPEPTAAAAGITEEPTNGDGQTIYIVIGAGTILALLLTVLSVLLLYRLRRLPAGDDSLAYRGIVSLATRLGHGPHPSQTEYEYASSLSDAIPTVRDELYVVADARVETAYGQRRLDAERRGLLRQAYARIRTALLRLSLRRKR